ncbi:protein kinase [bacterium]|nr:protein kinase [bacterium]
MTARCTKRRLVVHHITIMAAAWLHRHGFLSSEVIDAPTAGEATTPLRGVYADVLADTYALGKVIGEGAYAVVRECRHRQTGVAYAVKIMHMEKMPRSRIQNEISAMMKISHPNCLPLVDVFVESSIYLVMDIMLGGTVLDRIVEMDFYSEAVARDVVVQVLKALEYLHSCGFLSECGLQARGRWLFLTQESHKNECIP